MGIFDNWNFNPSPQSLGLIGMGAQMLQNSGPSLEPNSFSKALGHGLQGFNQAYIPAVIANRENMDEQLKQGRIAARQLVMQGKNPFDPNLVKSLISMGDMEGALQLAKVQKDFSESGKTADEYIQFIDSDSNLLRLGKKSGTIAPWTDANTGQPYTGKSAIYDTSSIAERTRAQAGNKLYSIKDAQDRSGYATGNQISPALNINGNGKTQYQQGNQPITPITPNNADNADNAQNTTAIEPIWYSMADALLPHIVQVESGNNPNAISNKGAIGQAQLMPDTAKELGVNPYVPSENLQGGREYLAQMLKRFNGNMQQATEAYNNGPYGDLSGNTYSNKVFNSQPSDLNLQPIRGYGMSAQEKADLELEQKRKEVQIKKPLNDEQQFRIDEKKAKKEADFADALSNIDDTRLEFERLKTIQDRTTTGPIAGSPPIAMLRKWGPNQLTGGEDLQRLEKGYNTLAVKAIAAFKAGGVTFGQLSNAEGAWIKSTQASIDAGKPINEEMLNEGIRLLDGRKSRILTQMGRRVEDKSSQQKEINALRIKHGLPQL
jgi:hypothetical protein